MSALTLFHMSDPHFGAEDEAALAWFAGAVAREQPDAVICTGDITMRGTTREFDAATEWFARLAVPAHIEPGNHDMPYYGEMLTRLRQPYTRFCLFRSRAPEAPLRDDLTLVPLWTIVPAQWRLNWAQGCVPAQRLGAARASLAEAPAAALKLVLAHHPLVDGKTEGKGQTRGGKPALAALAAAGADAVLSGHVHDPFDMTMDAGGRPIRMIGAGTLSTRLRNTPPSYNRLLWSAEAGLTVKVEVKT